jgi:UDP-N-acetylmuramoylalanine--D-glutamate ligase
MRKRFVILGAGESGVGAAILAKKQGLDVFVSDAGSIKEKYKKELLENDVEFEEQHTEEIVLSAEEVMKSPGIPDKNELVKKIRAAGIPVISEIELAYRYIGNGKIIGITGSNGKTTTTSLIYHICKKAEMVARSLEISVFQLLGKLHSIPKNGMWLRSAVFSWMILRSSEHISRSSRI